MPSLQHGKTVCGDQHSTQDHARRVTSMVQKGGTTCGSIVLSRALLLGSSEVSDSVNQGPSPALRPW